MFDKPKLKDTQEIVSNAKEQARGNKASAFRTKTQQKKDMMSKRKKTFLERMQEYAEQNAKQARQGKK